MGNQVFNQNEKAYEYYFDKGEIDKSHDKAITVLKKVKSSGIDLLVSSS